MRGAQLDKQRAVGFAPRVTRHPIGRLPVPVLLKVAECEAMLNEEVVGNEAHISGDNDAAHPLEPPAHHAVGNEEVARARRWRGAVLANAPHPFLQVRSLP